MAMEDMVPTCADIDKAGFWSVECWGGATFDACIRFLNEDPWERLRTFRKLMPNSRLQMLFRGQNLLAIAIMKTAWWSASWRNQRTTAWTCSAFSMR
jgi:pyruvate/oxaloacetate carboxyltransferase